VQLKHRNPTLAPSDSGFVGGRLPPISQKHAAIEQVSRLRHRCHWALPYGNASQV